MAGYEIFETPEAVAAYAEAASDLLSALAQRVYPALRADPTNQTGWHPVTYARGDFVYTVETPEGGLYLLVYQVIPEPRRVLVFHLATVREP